MPEIRFRLPGGDVRTIDAKDGESLMRIAVNNNIGEMEGECGGEVSCATYHVYLPAEVFDKVTPLSRDENDLLEVMDNYRKNSRLAARCGPPSCEKASRLKWRHPRIEPRGNFGCGTNAFAYSA